ncbi:MAG: hypothetical protein NTZ32_01150 [Planctomycetales bacterium]|nr:hypothetical protein [Planctomycetales bacterium]
MTDAASKDDSENNLAAFELGVYANQFLWNLDQAFVAESEPHRNMALGLIERLSAIGAAFTEMKNNAPFENFLREIRGYLPATLGSQRAETLEDFISEIFNVDSDLSEGERWYQFLDPFGQEREKLRKILFDDTVQTLQQRKWFRLGWLIDAGRHPPDTGHCLYKFQPTRNRRRLPPALAQPNLINDDEPEVPMFRTFEAGELSPQGEWWQSVFGLGQQLDVPCNSNEPVLSTASTIVEIVEQLIESARKTIAANAPSLLTALNYEYQWTPPGSPNDGTERKDQKVTSPAGGEAGIKSGDSGTPQQNAGESGSAGGHKSSLEGKKLTPDGEGPALKGKDLTRSKWNFSLPVDVTYGDSCTFRLVDLSRKLFARLVNTNNPQGWVNWKSLADDVWTNNKNNKNKTIQRMTVIKGIDRLNVILQSGLKCDHKPIKSDGTIDDLCYRIDPSLR